MKSKAELEAIIQRDKRAVLLVNTHSRKGKALLARAEHLLAERGIHLTAIYAVGKPKHLNQLIEQALAHKPHLLIVGSGDGTISEVAHHLAYRDTVLAFLPLGTTNNFARSLGLPFELTAAIDVINDGKVADIDLGKIGDHHFANVAGIGMSVDIAARVSPRLKRRLGRSAYTLSGIKAFLTHQAFTVRLTTETGTVEYVTHQLVIANGRFHGGTLIARDASIDDRKLIVFRLGDTTRWHLAKSLTNFVLGKKRTLSDDTFLTTEHVTIETIPALEIEIDGELKAQTPTIASIAPEALKIMVPQSFDDD
jgi:YegS/Rv2252/BmrU family lipid kinase